jgi:2-oxoisovalerate dehydrogenase E1 component
MFDAMAGSRHIDVEARRLRERGHGFYTIGSAGHESNASSRTGCATSCSG